MQSGCPAFIGADLLVGGRSQQNDTKLSLPIRRGRQTYRP